MTISSCITHVIVSIRYNKDVAYRSDAAWKDANYAQIWEYLRDDFELDERFESLDFKLNIIQVGSWFLLLGML